MQRIQRRNTRIEIVDLFKDLSETDGLLLGDQTDAQRFGVAVAELLSRSQSNPALLYGKRTEAMFAYVAAGLGKCSALKEEDAGDLFAATENLQQPDYRIVLSDGAEWLVEVKNCHKLRRMTLTKKYVAKLLNYGRTFQRPVQLAVYWSRWNVWTLVPLERLSGQGTACSLTFVDAISGNEMVSLGDYSVATIPPLALRVTTDRKRPRKLTPFQDRAEFTVGGYRLYCNSKRIERSLEKSLALYFILFGRWSQRSKLEVRDDQVEWVDFISEPEQAAGDQPFDIVGELSGMISREFTFHTASAEGDVQRLRPLRQPGRFGVRIPDDYKGRQLPLWMFKLEPTRQLNDRT